MRFLAPFNDDSSLIFAASIAAPLRSRGHTVEYLYIREADKPDQLSQRQLRQHLGDWPFEVACTTDLFQKQTLVRSDAVLVSKVVEPMSRALGDDGYKTLRDRPCFIAFHPGLELTPQRGLINRRNFDAYFLKNRHHQDRFNSLHKSRHWQHVSFGHPYAMFPAELRRPTSGNVYFFAQAMSPKSLRSRQHVVRVLAAIARANPDRTVVVKLRHLPDENRNHVHREEYPYPEIIAGFPGGVPPNLAVSDCSMQEALADAACCITCTSTAAIDSISAGVPVAVYLDYVDFLSDKLRQPMRDEFDASGIVTPLQDLLHLRVPRPDPLWMSSRFRDDGLYDEIVQVVTAFKARQ